VSLLDIAVKWLLTGRGGRAQIDRERRAFLIGELGIEERDVEAIERVLEAALDKNAEVK
tara:strand:+ start:956 stop:1132 length:177 start_codon:yes stop_codon:yes gene_type:complete